MELKLTRSLNGIPKTLEEMKSLQFESKVFSEIIHGINKRLGVATNDNTKNLC